MLYRKGLKILKATVGVESNKEELLPQFPFKIEVKSLLTDFRDVERIEYSEKLDGYISIEESSHGPSFEFLGDKALFRGQFLKLAEEASDLRFSLWGNQGFLYRFILYLLEKKHRIYNFHACALYSKQKGRLYIVIGGAGSGKTVYLLSGLTKGLKLFSTETVHFRIEKDFISWFKGSLVDNIRIGNLIDHFPQFLPEMEYKKNGEEWQQKIALDLSSYSIDIDRLENPAEVVIIFPRIEEGRKGFILNSFDDKRKVVRALFENISQKLTETFILYDKIPILGIDEQEMADARLKAVNQVAKDKTVIKIVSILSNPYDCWDHLLD
jgi:hypothetical protein